MIPSNFYIKLFYKNSDQINQDTSIHVFLENLLGQTVETFPIEDHRKDYDHNNIPDYFPNGMPMSSGCWCDIPDLTNPTWPKLHVGKNNICVASGQDILNLTESDVRKLL